MRIKNNLSSSAAVLVLLTALCMSLASVRAAYAEEATINFRDVDIVSAIESVAVLTGKTFIVDPRVRGKISIISADAVNSDAIYDIFLSALSIQGFQAVSDGQSVKILPAAKSASISTLVGGSEFITEIVKLTGGSGEDYVGILKPMLGPGAIMSYHKPSNSIVVSDTEAQVKRIKSYVRDLEEAAFKEFEIIQLRHISATDLVSMATETGLLDERTTVVGDKVANRVILTGPAFSRVSVRRLAMEMDVPSKISSSGTGIEVIFLKHADALAVQPVLESLLQSMAFKEMVGDQKSDQTQNYTIQADKANNALIVAASSQVTDIIGDVVNKLDRPRAQVLIEAVIAEVSEDFFNEISVNLAAVGKNGVFLADFGGALSTLAGAAVGGSASDQASALSSLQGSAIGAVGSVDRSGQGLASLVQAIRTDTKNTLLSTPSILTLENEEATISIGKEVPFVTGSYTSSNNGASNPFQTIERKEVGTILKVRPQISAAESVRLEILQEVSNIDQTSVQGASGTNVTTDKKVIQTNVAVGQNQTLVLGGLIDRKFSVVESKVPVLGDLPLLGALFRGKQKSQDTSVLMVFIRPTILQSPADAQRLSTRKYELLYGKYENFINRNGLEAELGVLPQDIGSSEAIESLIR